MYNRIGHINDGFCPLCGADASAGAGHSGECPLHGGQIEFDQINGWYTVVVNNFEPVNRRKEHSVKIRKSDLYSLVIILALAALGWLVGEILPTRAQLVLAGAGALVVVALLVADRFIQSRR